MFCDDSRWDGKQACEAFGAFKGRGIYPGIRHFILSIERIAPNEKLYWLGAHQPGVC